MKNLEQKYFKNQTEFRTWLVKNSETSQGICIVFYKKHVNHQCISYHEALDEALCFGWIDSIVRRLDDEKYTRKFTPRKNTANWSDINKAKVFTLIKQGKMTIAGLNKIDSYLKTGIVKWPDKKTEPNKTKHPQCPDFIIEAFAKNEPSLKNFNQLTSTYKQHYINWITNAKRQITIQKRVQESIELLKQNKKLGIK